MADVDFNKDGQISFSELRLARSKYMRIRKQPTGKKSAKLDARKSQWDHAAINLSSLEINPRWPCSPRAVRIAPA